MRAARPPPAPFAPADPLRLCVRAARILNVTQNPTPELPVMAEWERVNLAICRAIWAKYDMITALSTSLHVNGDGRPAAERGGAPFEPGPHGSTCTIGHVQGDGFVPIDFFNRLPQLGGTGGPGPRAQP